MDIRKALANTTGELSDKLITFFESLNKTLFNQNRLPEPEIVSSDDEISLNWYFKDITVKLVSKSSKPDIWIYVFYHYTFHIYYEKANTDILNFFLKDKITIK